MKKQRLPRGWTQKRIQELAAYHDNQTEEEQAAELSSAAEEDFRRLVRNGLLRMVSLGFVHDGETEACAGCGVTGGEGDERDVKQQIFVAAPGRHAEPAPRRRIVLRSTAAGWVSAVSPLPACRCLPAAIRSMLTGT